MGEGDGTLPMKNASDNAESERPPHEDWCPFGDHKGECYEQLMECMKKGDPERWADLIDGSPDA